MSETSNLPSGDWARSALAANIKTHQAHIDALAESRKRRLYPEKYQDTAALEAPVVIEIDAPSTQTVDGILKAARESEERRAA